MSDMEWFSGRSIDERMAQCYWKRVIALLASGAVLLILFWPLEAKSEPMFQTVSPDGIVITLHSEKCDLKEIVNLPKRATWQEKAKSYEGCWGLNPLGVVMFYFTDKTIAVVPAEAFQKVTGV